jgi:small-conductance mechanosensitive channel
MKDIIIEQFRSFLEKIAEFLPNIFIGFVLIIVGLVVAWLLSVLITRAGQVLRLDHLSERSGLVQILHRSGIKEPFSKLLGKLVYWVILITFIIMGLNAFHVPAVENILSTFLLYLPNVIVAGIILFLGYLLGNFLGRAALIASVNAGLAVSGLVGRLVKYTVFIMAVAMALELLGIGKDTVLIAFAIIFGGVVLALAIAFGLGGRDAARDYIDRILKEKKEKKDEIEHL